MRGLTASERRVLRSCSSPIATEVGDTAVHEGLAERGLLVCSTVQIDERTERERWEATSLGRLALAVCT